MKFFNVQIILILIKFVIMFKLISILLTLIHLIPLAHAELDTIHTSEGGKKLVISIGKIQMMNQL